MICGLWFSCRGVLSEKRIRTVAILSVSLHRQTTYANRAPAKSALYVTTEAVTRIAKIHNLVMKSSYLSVRIFETTGNAARRLRVPKEMLALDPIA
jgi:hypothetical protein